MIPKKSELFPGRRFRSLRMAFSCLFAIFLFGVIGQAHADVARESLEDGAVGFIAEMSNSAIALMGDKQLSVGRRKTRFRALLKDHFDLRTIGRWVLGRYWRTASPGQRNEFLILFEDLMVRTYMDRFGDYNGEHLKIENAVGVGKRDVLVDSALVSPETRFEPVRIQWRVRVGSGRYRIIDVMVAGVSLGQTQRSEFASVIRESGGKVEGLLARLRQE